MNKRSNLAVIAMAALGLTTGAIIVLPGPPARADTTPPDYVTGRTFNIQWEVNREAINVFACRARCRGAFADGGGAKPVWVPVGGGYIRRATRAGCLSDVDDLCTTEVVAHAPAE